VAEDTFASLHRKRNAWRNNPACLARTLSKNRTNASSGHVTCFISGIRGVGSLLYALSHAPHSAAAPLAVIAASVILHGITSTPLMNRYRRS
jgi:NhaP-type Na+/H+ or K+/H+ antiporter